MISDIAHVCLNVKDLNRTIPFYLKLGFKPKFQLTRNGSLYGIYLQIGTSSFIEIFEDKHLETPVNTGFVHFCLETKNIDTLIDMLKREKIEHTPKKLGCDHTWQIWLKDPDGNNFEVHQYTEESLQFKGGIVEADW
ncbi:MAG TPA: VOC family protein [Chitinispirillaceae bacterium]|nr:VOC family protein [Chitinispirillaceae bacterium]